MVGTRRTKQAEGNNMATRSSTLSPVNPLTSKFGDRNVSKKVHVIEDELLSSGGRATRRRQVSKKMQEWMEDRQQKYNRRKRGSGCNLTMASGPSPKRMKPSRLPDSTTNVDIPMRRDVIIADSRDANNEQDDDLLATGPVPSALSSSSDMPDEAEAHALNAHDPTCSADGEPELETEEIMSHSLIDGQQRTLESGDLADSSLHMFTHGVPDDADAQATAEPLEYGADEGSGDIIYSLPTGGDEGDPETIEQIIIDHSERDNDLHSQTTRDSGSHTQTIEHIIIDHSERDNDLHSQTTRDSGSHTQTIEQIIIDHSERDDNLHSQTARDSASHTQTMEQIIIDPPTHTLHKIYSEQPQTLEEMPDGQPQTLEEMPDSQPKLDEELAAHIGMSKESDGQYECTHEPLHMQAELASSLIATEVNDSKSEQHPAVRSEQPLIISPLRPTNDSEEVGIMLTSNDTVTQALLESFMVANSAAGTPPISAEPVMNSQHHTIGPNIKLTEHIQVDANGRKQTVVYLSTDAGSGIDSASTPPIHTAADTVNIAETVSNPPTNRTFVDTAEQDQLTPSYSEQSRPSSNIRIEPPIMSSCTSSNHKNERETKVLSRQNICTISDDGQIKQQEVVLEVYVNSPPTYYSSENAGAGLGESAYTYSAATAPDGNEGAGQINHEEHGDKEDTQHIYSSYSCLYCHYKSDKRSNLVKHGKKHHEDRPHVCEFPGCNYSAKNFGNLKRHELSHTDERRFPCPECDLRFKQKIHLDKHINYLHREKTVQCELCDYKCANRIPDLKLHMKRRHLKSEPDDPPTYLECEKCGFLAGSKKDLKQHFKFHKRGPELKLFCEHCSFVTDAKSRLDRHRMIHTREKPFSCGICDYTASQKEHIQRHYRTRHGDTAEVVANSRQLIFQQTVSTTTAASSTEDVCPISYSIDSVSEEPSSAPAVEVISHEEAETGQPKDEAEVRQLKEEAKDETQHSTMGGGSLLEANSAAAEATAAQPDDEKTQGLQQQPESSIPTTAAAEPLELGKANEEIVQESVLQEEEGNLLETVVGEPVELAEESLETLTSPGGVVIVPPIPPDSGGAVTGSGKVSTRPTVKYSPPDYSQKPKSFACTHCTMKFVRLLSLYKHLHTQHSDLLPDTEEEKLTCVVCDFKAQSHKTLLKHMRRHNTQDALEEQEVPGMLYVCVLCKYMNSKRRNLYQHLKKKHKLSIIVKKDGTASCVVEPNADVTVVATSQGQQVTQVVAEAGFSGDSNKVVDIVDLANSLTQKHDLSHLIQRVAVAGTKTEQDAAEAIVDLATQNVTIVDLASQYVVQEEEISPAATTGILEADESGHGQLQITAQQLHSLSSGDYIEINGQTYMVEVNGDTMTAVLCETAAVPAVPHTELMTATKLMTDVKGTTTSDDDQLTPVIINSSDGSRKQNSADDDDDLVAAPIQ